MTAKGNWIYDRNLLIPLCDGKRTSKEIALILGWPAKHVQKIMRALDLPRLPQAPRVGEHNPSYKSGRKIDMLGYVHVSAPLDHPYQRRRPTRKYGDILEHRLVMEKHLGRYLEPIEVVDHIDGIRLHNDLSNLRLFATNADHLKETLKGRVPVWSKMGYENMKLRHRQPIDERIHNHSRLKASGDIRLQQILLALLKLGIDSPYLFGTKHWLDDNKIDYSSRPKIEHELEKINQRLESLR